MSRQEDGERVLKALCEATLAIKSVYFKLPIDGISPIFRERAYCYELYHQMRSRLEDIPYILTGEADKRGHAILRDLGLDNTNPDFLVHRPGPGGMQHNLAIIEVKTADQVTEEIAYKDLEKLTQFVASANYEIGIYLIYGEDIRTLDRGREWAKSERFGGASSACIWSGTEQRRRPPSITAGAERARSLLEKTEACGCLVPH